MDMGMKGKIASPGVENTDETDLSAEMPGVTGQILEGFSTAVIEQVEKKTSVGKKETVELFWNREDSMEIGCVNHIVFSGINPFLPVEGLAAGTMPVSAGIVVDPGVAAVLTDCKVASKKGCLA